jgi:hypothetical protein
MYDYKRSVIKNILTKYNNNKNKNIYLRQNTYALEVRIQGFCSEIRGFVFCVCLFI